MSCEVSNENDAVVERIEDIPVTLHSSYHATNLFTEQNKNPGKHVTAHNDTQTLFFFIMNTRTRTNGKGRERRRAILGEGKEGRGERKKT